MFKNILIACVVFAALMETSGAFGQRTAPPSQFNSDRVGGTTSGRGGTPLFGIATSPTVTLLRTPEVRTELKLEDDKAKKLDEINDATSRERARLITEYNAKMAELNKKAEEQAVGLLSEAQRQRTEQLRLQQQGIRALATSEVAEKLGLSQQQRDEISKLTRFSSSFGGPGGGFGIRRAGDSDTPAGAGRDNAERPGTNPPNETRQSAADRFRQLSEEANKRAAETREKILALLTPEQKAKWSTMTGEPFQFPSRSRTSTRTLDRPKAGADQDD